MTVVGGCECVRGVAVGREAGDGLWRVWLCVFGSWNVLVCMTDPICCTTPAACCTALSAHSRGLLDPCDLASGSTVGDLCHVLLPSALG
jgi:hypothetical protein